MASKISNQITFTEQKQIQEVKEWYLATTLETGVTHDTEGWTSEVQSINSKTRYLWNYEEVIYSIGPSEVSDPVLIGIYGTGVGISDITNYYGVTTEPALPSEMPENFWKIKFADVGLLSNDNKYLWNYEEIFYTDGTSKPTEPSIIGVYGDSGEDAITFRIYSPVGFEFKDSVNVDEQLTSIELKIGAFKGGEPLTGATYTWSYFDATLNGGTGGYQDIEGYINIINPDETPFIVNNTDEYAFNTLKCTMMYDNKSYEDYVILTSKVDSYVATINFLTGSNVLEQTQEYVIGYVELYKNNKIDETVRTSNYYIGDYTVDSTTNIITPISDVQETDDSLSYFIRQIENDNDYEIILGEYQESSWVVIDNKTKYVYQTDINSNLSTNIFSNMFVIPKRYINKTQVVEVGVYTDHYISLDEDGNEELTIAPDSLVAIAHTTITDLNDIIISSDTPLEAYEGQMWLDTTNGLLYIYVDGAWASTSKHNIGQNTYTIKPNYYNKGDLWIVSSTDATSDFPEGSVWTAIEDSDKEFNPEHWSDAVPKITALTDDVRYYFDFNKDTGLKIGHNTDKFYVNLKPTRMSFCENAQITAEEIEEDIDPNEVVYISNRSATIRNLIAEESADFNCSVAVDNKVEINNTYEASKTNNPGFAWQIEANGSISLAKLEVN